MSISTWSFNRFLPLVPQYLTRNIGPLSVHGSLCHLHRQRAHPSLRADVRRNRPSRQSETLPIRHTDKANAIAKAYAHYVQFTVRVPTRQVTFDKRSCE